MFEVKRFDAISTGYQVVIHYRRYSQQGPTEEVKNMHSYSAGYQYIEQRTGDFIYFQLCDLITELKYRCHSDDDMAQALLAQLTSDVKYMLNLPHLQRCRFISEHVFINLESCIPQEDGYAKLHLTWAVDELKMIVGYELHWKQQAA